MPWLIIPGIIAGAYFIDKTGEAVDDTANAVVKLALAGGALFILAKKSKVI
jgi:hypothetical protein